MLDITENGPRELWNNTELNTWSATAVMVGGYLYGMHGPPEFINFLSWDAMLRVDWPIRCIDATTGAVMWEKKVEPFSLMAADNRLIMLALDGTLRIAEAAPSSYNELSRTNVMEDEDKQRIFATPPALYSGKIYCRNFFGDLVCIDVSK
jgi:outer membrane protein assembly factor BamB